MQVVQPETVQGRLPVVHHQKSRLDLVISVSALVIVATAFAYVLTTILSCLHLSFDLGDEGYYLLSSMHPREYQSPVSFQYLLQFIPSFTQCRVMDFRFAQVFGQLLGAALLSAGYLGWLRKAQILEGKVALTAAFVFCLLGNLLLFYKFPLSISYNSLTGLFLFSATGFLLMAGLLEGNANARQSPQILAITAAGVCTGLSLFAKFSAFFAFIPIAILTTLIFCPKRRLRNLLVLSGGITLALTIYFTQIQSFSSWLQPIIEWLQYIHVWKTKHSQIVQTYWESTLDIVKYFQPGLTIALTSAFFGSFALSKLKMRISTGIWKSISAALHVVLWGAVAWWLIGKDCLHHDMYKDCVFYIFALLSASEYAGFSASSFKLRSASAKPWQLWTACATVALVPFICSAGTGNVILFQCTIYLGAMFACLIGFAAGTARKMQLSLPLLSAVLVTCLFSVCQFTDGFNHPFGVESRTLKEQVQETHLRNLKGIKVTAPMARFLTDLDTCLRANGFRSGDTIVALYNMPGVIYAVDGKSAMVSWYMRFPNSSPYNSMYLNRLKVPSSGRLFVLQGFELEPDITATLSGGKVGFPQNFRKVGVVKGPFNMERPEMQQYRPYLYDEVRIYALNSPTKGRTL